MGSYVRPQSLDEAVDLLAAGQHRILAGGTDLYPVAGADLAGEVLDVTDIPSLRGIVQDGDLRIGACATWSEIAAAPLPPALRALQQAARHVGGRQIQNAGTIGGNLCNASPAADGVPPLLIVDAIVELASLEGLRRMALSAFLSGPRQTARRADEVLTAIIVPKAAFSGQSSFEKLGARAYLVISIAMVAARIVMRDGRIETAAIAVGACSGVARRLPLVEAALTGLDKASVPTALRAQDMAAALSSIDDIRATACYRDTAATELVARAIAGVL